MADKKTFLDSEGARYLVQQVKQIISSKLSREEAEDLIAAEAPAVATSQDAGLVKPGTGLAVDENGVLSIAAGYDNAEIDLGILATKEELNDYVKEADFKAMTNAEIDAIFMRYFPMEAGSVAEIKKLFATSGDYINVKLSDNISMSEALVVPAGKSASIDLNGQKLTIVNNGLSVRGELTIDGDGEIESPRWGIEGVGENAKVIINGGKISAQEAPIAIQQGAKLELNDGELEGFDNCPVMGQGSPGQGNVEMVMNGGKLIAHISSPGYIACGVYMPNSGKFIMNGGEIVSDGVGLVMRAGEVELNGGSITANGATGIKGKVGDSRVVVGPYAVVYDELAKYPGASDGPFALTIGEDMVLSGTDGDVDVLLSDGAVANITDNRAANN